MVFLGCSEVKMCFCRYMQGKESLDNKLICTKTNRVAVYRARRVFVMRCTKYIPADNAHEGARQYIVIYKSKTLLHIVIYIISVTIET